MPPRFQHRGGICNDADRPVVPIYPILTALVPAGLGRPLSRAERESLQAAGFARLLRARVIQGGADDRGYLYRPLAGGVLTDAPRVLLIPKEPKPI